jgi:hypothetical protein
MFAVKNSDGERIYDEEQTKQRVKQYYSELFAQRIPEPEVNDWIDQVKREISQFQQCMDYEQDPINKSLDRIEVVRATQQTKYNKAVGPDNIPN